MITLDMLMNANEKKEEAKMLNKDKLIAKMSSKTKIITKSAKDLYNDPEIMKNEPPYPFIPENVGKYFRSDFFKVELLEEYDENGKFLGFSIGKEGLCSIRGFDLEEVIKKWNGYCKSKIRGKFKEEAKNKRFWLFAIASSSFIIAPFIIPTTLMSAYILFILLSLGIYEKVFNNYEKKAEEHFKRNIEWFINNHSGVDIKIMISSPQTNDLSVNEKIQTKEDNKCNEEIIEQLTFVLNMLNSDSLKYMNFQFKNNLQLSSIKTELENLIKNYNDKNDDTQINNQLKNDILRYTNNLIQALNLIKKHKTLSKEMKLEICELINNYSAIFKHFNNLIIQADEDLDIIKLKVLNQESKVYKDYIDIKEE